MRIPKIIWQTYKDPIETLAPYMQDAMQTWKDLNPEYEHGYMDDVQAAEFVLKEYGKEWHDIFTSFPVGVMRGDLWRYLITYKYGGVYTDLDTKCHQPISSWILEDKGFIVCPENNIHFCQWTFAAEPNNPILKAVLDLIKEKMKNPDYTKPHFVHEITGPYVWTQGILSALQLDDKIPLVYTENMDQINLSDKAKEYGFYSFSGDKWRMFHFMASEHLYGSQNWKDGSYVQWIEDPLTKAYGAGVMINDREEEI
jgi:mannosyltransferase OCH1-like enzyme